MKNQRISDLLSGAGLRERMKKIIALIFLAAVTSSHAAPVTLTAYGTHVLLGPSAADVLHDWRLTLTYDGSAIGETTDVDVEAILYQDFFSGKVTSSIGPLFGGTELFFSGEPQPVGEVSWSFETIGNKAPTKDSDLVGKPYIYSFSRGMYAEYVPDRVTVSTAAVPEPGTYGLMLSGLACMVVISASRRRQGERRG